MLKHALQRAVDRPLHGDFLRLFRMLRTMVDPLNGKTLESLGDVKEILKQGKELTWSLPDIPLNDDVIDYATGLGRVHPERIRVMKEAVSS